MVKSILIGLILVILFFLFVSAARLVKRSSDDQSAVVRGLTWRIGLSILAFVIILAANMLGYIQPSSSLRYLRMDVSQESAP